MVRPARLERAACGLGSRSRPLSDEPHRTPSSRIPLRSRTCLNPAPECGTFATVTPGRTGTLRARQDVLNCAWGTTKRSPARRRDQILFRTGDLCILEGRTPLLGNDNALVIRISLPVPISWVSQAIRRYVLLTLPSSEDVVCFDQRGRSKEPWHSDPGYDADHSHHTEKLDKGEPPFLAAHCRALSRAKRKDSSGRGEDQDHQQTLSPIRHCSLPQLKPHPDTDQGNSNKQKAPHRIRATMTTENPFQRREGTQEESNFPQRLADQVVQPLRRAHLITWRVGEVFRMTTCKTSGGGGPERARSVCPPAPRICNPRSLTEPASMAVGVKVCARSVPA